jgi:hypothetical protein
MQDGDATQEEDEEFNVNLSEFGRLINNIVFAGHYDFEGEIAMRVNIPHIKAKRFKRRGVLKLNISDNDEYLDEFDKLEIRKTNEMGFDIKKNKIVAYLKQESADSLYNMEFTGVAPPLHIKDFPVSLMIFEPANQDEITHEYTTIEEEQE